MSKKKPQKKDKPSKSDGKAAAAKSLTHMQQAFILHYCNDPKHNATQAALKAGYSEGTAGQQGYENLKKPEIKSAIVAKLDERYDDLDITGKRIIREIAKVAFGNLTDVATWDGDTVTLRGSDELGEDAAALMKSISVSESSSSSDKGDSSSKTISFGTFDKIKALELLAKNKKLLTEKFDITGKIGLEALVAGSHDTGAEKD